MRQLSYIGMAALMIVCLGGCPPEETAKVAVPNVVGQIQLTATHAILDAGLSAASFVYEYSDTIAFGCVVGVEPPAGTMVAEGAPITLKISNGPEPLEMVNVPGVVGETQAAASSAIVAAGLAVGSITASCSHTVEAGIVIRQIPPEGEEATEGDTVAVIVSSGPCAMEVEMAPVAAGAFIMGRTGALDDHEYGFSKEDPQHEVALSAYEIGKYEITNDQFCEVLNWALAHGYLTDLLGEPWEGDFDPYTGGDPHMVIATSYEDCNIQFVDGVFSSKTRPGEGGLVDCYMGAHPVEDVTWFGAAAFCNWLSEMLGLTVCYDMNTPDWPLIVAPPSVGGYRLPTEAEWERAAAWDGTKHFIYGFSSDINDSNDQCNDWWNDGVSNNWVNPLGIIEEPFTSPVGWFDGINMSPNGGVLTAYSVSPVGCFDMSGNVREWCGDWFSSTYYQGGAMTNPTGPTTGTDRSLRGGSWYALPYHYCRTAARDCYGPNVKGSNIGFRIARSS